MSLPAANEVPGAPPAGSPVPARPSAPADSARASQGSAATSPSAPAAGGSPGVAQLGFEALSPSGPEIQVLPIDLPTALRLVNASNPTIGVARARVREAYARLRQAQVLWLPNLESGPAYLRHDGILQTLLSIEIQLDVLRRKVPAAGTDQVNALANLQQTVRNEAADLRQTVTDLRPLRVQSADLVDLMRGFAERYRNESTIALDLLIDSTQLRAPDRVCREIFQIYREALNNIKKHAKASHVVVKLSQDDSRLVLVVDDNGEGFSFAGRFTGDELDRLRLGPISIKERSRTVGGILTVESNPGHGARLTIEVPLG